MSQFDYLIAKIEAAPIEDFPFRLVLINDFFTPEHFARIVASRQVRLPECATTAELVERLGEAGYAPIEFPGCITDIEEYVAFADKGKRFNKFKIKGYGRDVIEGYGVTFRARRFDDEFLAEMVAFFNSARFADTIATKLGVEGEYAVETGLQKNLQHYEISPHPDTSRKAATYMVNIYTEDDVADKEMHTHFCRLTGRYAYLYDFWKSNDVDPVWVPWAWAETVRRTNTNNSISMFAPAHDTLHAVRVTESHLTHQRNQIYGNLWYPTARKTGNLAWQDLDLPAYANASRVKRVARRVLA